MTKPGKDQTRYEVILQEDETTGDILMPIPQVLLDQLGWKEGDDVEFGITPEGNYFLKKHDK